MARKFSTFRFPFFPFPLLFRVVLVVFVPLLKDFLPVDNFAVGNGLGLLYGLIVQFLFGMAQFHRLNCGVIKYVNATTAQALVKVGWSKGLALYVFPSYSPLVSHSNSLTTNVIAATVLLDTSHTVHLLFKFYLSPY